VRIPWFPGQGSRVKSPRWSGGGKAAFIIPAVISYLTHVSLREMIFQRVYMRQNPMRASWQFHCLWNLPEVMAAG
jgi:hypothetical protein